MGTVLGFVWFVVGCVVFNTAILVWAALMLPNPVERARQRLERRGVGTFFLGLVLTVVSVFLWVAMVNAPNGVVKLLGWLVLSPTLAAAVVGGAGIARIAADRIAPRLKNESEMVALVGGALSTSAAGWTPVVGWFLFFPALLMLSVGAGLLALLSKRRVAEEAARVPAGTPAAYPGHQPAAQLAPTWDTSGYAPTSDFNLPQAGTTAQAVAPQA